MMNIEKSLDNAIKIDVQSLKLNLKNIPENSGIYQFIDEKSTVLYVGKAKNLRKRIANYTNKSKLSSRIARMVNLAQHLEYIQTNNEIEALLLEHNLIKKFLPNFNILLRDSKSFPYILITKNHNFPAIVKHRGLKKEKGEYFGPFADITSVNRAIEVIKKNFLIRNCSDQEFKIRVKPCMEFQIKKCSAPCVNKISYNDYQLSVEQSIDFLRGKSVSIQEKLKQEMQYYSDLEQYEKAATIRDKIKSLTTIQAKQNIHINHLGNSDIIVIKSIGNLVIILVSFYRLGNNYGSKPYFYNIEEQKDFIDSNNDNDELAIKSILWQFLGQFYLINSHPDTILLNILPNNDDIDGDSKLNSSLDENIDFIRKTCQKLAIFISNLQKNDDNKNIENNYQRIDNDSKKQKLIIKIPKKGDDWQLIKEQEQLAIANLQQKINLNSNNSKHLMAIKELFSLDKIPQRIEVYDNSHFSGSNQVGVVIVATIDGFLKNHYRKFNLQSNQTIDIALNEIKDQQTSLNKHQSQDNRTKIAGDDLSLLYEVLNRRFASKNKDKQEDNTKYPDFILIDGGINQLNVAWEVFSQLGININFACISKGEKRNAGEEIFHFYLRDSNDRAVYHNFTLPKNHQLMFYLQRLRDEAHRFAITTHRKRRANNFITSTLDNIEGIGKVRKKLLLQHFGSINKIADAKINDLIMVKGINKDLASKIISELKK